MKADYIFRAFEYAAYNTRSEGNEGKKLPADLYEALKSFSGEKDLPYYSLTANGVRFKNFVGALQVGKWTVEILPKLDRTLNESSTQPVLIQMIRQAGIIRTSAPTESKLKLRKNYILEAYIDMFLEETRIILRKSLIRKYQKKEENALALKGSLNFSKHISSNLTHAERFYIRHTIYDKQHKLNQVLLKTLRLISTLTVSHALISEANKLMIQFPELCDVTVSEELFSQLTWDRKTETYKKAVEISRLLLLNYHPDLSHGRNHVLALLFDMNEVWEKWFAKRLKMVAKKTDSSIEVKPQIKKTFWFPSAGKAVAQKPDLVIYRGDQKIILDTKWKIINDRPSEDDLRQMFAYNKLYQSDQAFLVYPGNRQEIAGDFFSKPDHGTCGLKFVAFLENGNLTDNGIVKIITEWNL